MAPIPDLSVDLNKQRVFETAEKINITKRTFEYGSSVYQVRNITGFKAGKVPKEKFPFQAVIVLVALGLVLISFTNWGWLLLILAGFLVFQHFKQTQYYGLSIFLNSGKELFFKDSNQSFINDLVADIYTLMESQQDGKIEADMSTHISHYEKYEDKSITAGGDIKGASTGDGNWIDVKGE